MNKVTGKEKQSQWKSAPTVHHTVVKTHLDKKIKEFFFQRTIGTSSILIEMKDSNTLLIEEKILSSHDGFITGSFIITDDKVNFEDFKMNFHKNEYSITAPMI